MQKRQQARGPLCSFQMFVQPSTHNFIINKIKNVYSTIKTGQINIDLFKFRYLAVCNSATIYLVKWLSERRPVWTVHC